MVRGGHRGRGNVHRGDHIEIRVGGIHTEHRGDRFVFRAGLVHSVGRLDGGGDGRRGHATHATLQADRCQIGVG